MLSVSFHLNGRSVGGCQLPPRFHRACDKPLSYHYFDPASGIIWATLEISGSEWNSFRIPSLANTLPAYASWPRGLQLTWLFGHGLYDDPDLLALLPRAVLEHEFLAHHHNFTRGLPLPL